MIKVCMCLHGSAMVTLFCTIVCANRRSPVVNAKACHIDPQQQPVLPCLPASLQTKRRWDISQLCVAQYGLRRLQVRPAVIRHLRNGMTEQM
jgi:hypothetical protein